MRRQYKDLADSFVGGGQWGTDVENGSAASRDDLKLAALFDIARSLRHIAARLNCPNVPKALKAMQALESLAREFWVKPPVRKTRRQAKR